MATGGWQELLFGNKRLSDLISTLKHDKKRRWSKEIY